MHKTNVLVHAGGLWARTVARVGEEFPDVTTDYLHVDAASIFMVTQPERFDVIVTDNLFGDIVTDLAAAITGGIGLAASGNLDVSRTNPSMFEPVHGSAPDIAGTGTADPTATILSVAMLLDHLGLGDAGAAVEAAVVADLAERGDARRSTRAVGDAVLARLLTSAAAPGCRVQVRWLPSAHERRDHRPRPLGLPAQRRGARRAAAGPRLRAGLHRPHGLGPLLARARAGTTPASRRTSR